VRVFFSIELPDEIKENIEKFIGGLKSELGPMKWISKNNLHVTLKFLGNVEENKIEDLVNTVGKLTKGFGPIKIDFGGFGAFPDPKHPRVIWTGINGGAGELKKLADKIEDELCKKGYGEEEREFSPHLTIGRIKESIVTAALSRFIKENEQTSLGSFVVNDISLMKSTLMKNGPVYEELKRISL
jgi:RNA 2',3'-cyclic 3'-phosphodiesterase